MNNIKSQSPLQLAESIRLTLYAEQLSTAFEMSNLIDFDSITTALSYGSEVLNQSDNFQNHFMKTIRKLKTKISQFQDTSAHICQINDHIDLDIDLKNLYKENLTLYQTTNIVISGGSIKLTELISVQRLLQSSNKTMELINVVKNMELFRHSLKKRIIELEQLREQLIKQSRQISQLLNAISHLYDIPQNINGSISDKLPSEFTLSNSLTQKPFQQVLLITQKITAEMDSIQ